MGKVTKDKLFLTKSNLAVSRSSIYFGVSAALLLGGCDTVSSVSSSVTSGVAGVFSGERVGQYADGPRRAPALNASTAAAPAPSPTAAKMPPMVTFVSPQKSDSSINNPYDQFDNNGDEVSVSTDMGSTSEDKGNFFSRLVGSNESSSVEPVQNDSGPKSTSLETGRKQLLGNPYSPKPLLSTPSLEPQVKEVVKEPEFEFVNKPAVAPEIVNAPIVESINIAEPAYPISVVEPIKESASENIVEESSEETLLGRIGSKLNVFDSNEKDESQEAYPEISSVPPKPEEFDAIKRDQQQNLNELKLDHTIAQQEKLSLDNEVSGSGPALVVVPSVQPVMAPAVEEKPSPFENKIKSLSEQPTSENIVAPLPFPEPEGSAVKDNIQPIIMEEEPAIVKGKRYSFDDVMESLSEQPASEKIVEPLPFPTPKENVIKDNIQPIIMEEKAPAVEEEPNFFERVFMTPKEQEASEKIEAPLPVTSLEEVKVEAPSAKTVEDKAMGNKDSELKPQLEQSSESTDSTAPLPSPDLIKTIRPSRYEGRRNPTQNSAY